MSTLKRRIVVTGLGIISPLGLTQESLWNAFLESKSGVTSCAFGPLPYTAPALFTGDIDDFGVTDVNQKKTIRKAAKLMGREIQMALAAAQRALIDTGFVQGSVDPARIGVSIGCDYIISTPNECLDGVIACTKGETFDFTRWGTEGLKRMTPIWQLKYLPNMPASHIAIINNFHGPSNSITLREASIGAVVTEASHIIGSGNCDMMIVGSTGSRLQPNKLIAAIQQEELARADVPPGKASRPFDVNRFGSVLGEGAGVLVLEELEHAKRRGATIYAEFLGGACAASIARNIVPNRREALRLAFGNAIKYAGLEPPSIGHVNAHGLSSKDSDREEAAAINDVFGFGLPVTAAKSYFGNLGAGAGAIEFIAGILALYNNKLFPTLNFTAADSRVSIVKDWHTKTGETFIKAAISPQGQASALICGKFAG